MEKVFKVDFHELLFLAEVCIPPKPIARTIFFEELSDIHFYQMTPQQRFKLFKVITEHKNFDMSNEYCQHFNARFNPQTQYKAITKEGKEIIHLYKFKETYHVKKMVLLNMDMVKSIDKCFLHIHENEF